MSDMQAWGARLRAAQDEAGDERRELASARAKLLAAQPEPRRSKLVPWPGVVSCALAACAVALFWWWPRERALTFRVAERPGVVHTWLESTSPIDLPVRFSDGSSLLLRRQTRARVEQVGRRGASIALQRGEIAVSVVHRQDTKWSIEAGPYHVDVIGTRFDVAFDPNEQAFSLDLHDGSVRLAGPGLAAGRTIVAGQRVELRRGAVERNVEPPTRQPPGGDAHDPAKPAAAPSKAATSAAGAVRDASASLATPPLLRGPRAAAAPPDWRAQATRGDYAGALAAAERQGFAAVLQSTKVDELLLLGDCAFYAQRDDMAQQIYGAIRARAPHTVQAAVAAFNLGRVAFRGEPAAPHAAVWFRTYLEEQPRGSLKREALGRLLEAERASGQLAAARKEAARYLREYPKGPHAGVADEVMLAPEP